MKCKRFGGKCFRETNIEEDKKCGKKSVDALLHFVAIDTSSDRESGNARASMIGFAAVDKQTNKNMRKI